MVKITLKDNDVSFFIYFTFIKPKKIIYYFDYTPDYDIAFL